jgi:hypothetical protein
VREDEMFIAFLELVDGGEVGANLFRMVGERFGFRFRDEAFAGFGIPPYGTPSPDKPALLQPIIERIRVRLGERECGEFLSACLRDLPDEDFLTERDMLEQAGSIDAYLVRRKQRFVQQLEECLREGKLFFAQEVTPEVLDYVRTEPEMGGGRREGSIVYETKIPYMTRQYLAKPIP